MKKIYILTTGTVLSPVLLPALNKIDYDLMLKINKFLVFLNADTLGLSIKNWWLILPVAGLGAMTIVDLIAIIKGDEKC